MRDDDYVDDEDYIAVSNPPALEVTDLENECVGVLLGPAGETLSRVYERAVVPMGFHPRKKSSRVVRFYA